MSSGLSLADHITLELRADIIGGRLLPGRALVEGNKPGAYDALSDYLDDSEQQLLELFNHPSRH